MTAERADRSAGGSSAGGLEWTEFDEDEEISLLETLDHVLDQGVVVSGDVTIAVADIDLVYVGVNLLLGSVETIDRVLGARTTRTK